MKSIPKSQGQGANRVQKYGSVANELSLLSDKQLSKLLSEAKHLGTSIGGTSALLEICSKPVFVKKVRLTDTERRPENRMSTKNVFDMPTYFQYGMSGSIGSIGFGAWRELAAHSMTTGWVLSGECPNFPLLYHWRELLRQDPKLLSHEELKHIERSVEFWGGLESVRKRFIACEEASTELVLFLEYFPENLRVSLHRQLSSEEKSYKIDLLQIEDKIQSVISFMNGRGLLHFDVHCGNIMAEGSQLYITDFGLAMSSDFELSDTELCFFKAHQNYDQHYASTYLVRLIMKELFGTEDREMLLREFAMGKNNRSLPPNIFSILAKDAHTALQMNEFFHKIKQELKDRHKSK